MLILWRRRTRKVTRFLPMHASLAGEWDENDCAHLIICDCSTNIARLLLANGADVSDESATGFQPMHCAAMNGHVDCIRCGRTCRLVATHPTRTGFCRLRAARLTSRQKPTASLQFILQVPNVLLCACRSFQCTFSASNGHINVVRFLIANGADIDARDGNGNTALVFVGSANTKDIQLNSFHSKAENAGETEIAALLKKCLKPDTLLTSLRSQGLHGIVHVSDLKSRHTPDQTRRLVVGPLRRCKLFGYRCLSLAHFESTFRALIGQP